MPPPLKRAVQIILGTARSMGVIVGETAGVIEVEQEEVADDAQV